MVAASNPCGGVIFTPCVVRIGFVIMLVGREWESYPFLVGCLAWWGVI